MSLAPGPGRRLHVHCCGQPPPYAFHHKPHVSAEFAIGAFDSSGAQVASSTALRQTIEVDFTPNASQTGRTTVEIIPWQGDSAIGTFTLTYATDVTGSLSQASRCR